MGHGLQPHKEKSQVSITKGRNAIALVREALSLIGGMQKIISPRSRVLIKPNLGVPLPARMGVTTEPKIVVALIEMAREAGAKEVVVGESSVVGFDAAAVFDALNVRSIFEKAGARVVSLDQDDVIEVPIPKGDVLRKLKVCRRAYESDVIISVPKMKTHFQTGVTLGLKNMKGTIPDESKRILHRIGIPVKKREAFGLDHAIVDLNTVLSPDLTVIDAIVSLEGFVPGPRLVGNPVPMNTVIAGFDPLAVDAVGCRVMGLDPVNIRHLRRAKERGLGRLYPEEIEIVGRSIRSVLHPLSIDISRPVLNYGNLSIVEGKGCSGCSVTNQMALSFLSRQDIAGLGLITLLVGDTKGIEVIPKGRCFFVGNCAIRCNPQGKGVKIGGCPPPGLWVRKGLMGSK
jgi:uncharacterized protein (DUF362 family)